MHALPQFLAHLAPRLPMLFPALFMMYGAGLVRQRRGRAPSAVGGFSAYRLGLAILVPLAILTAGLYGVDLCRAMADLDWQAAFAQVDWAQQMAVESNI